MSVTHIASDIDSVSLVLYMFHAWGKPDAVVIDPAISPMSGDWFLKSFML